MIHSWPTEIPPPLRDAVDGAITRLAAHPHPDQAEHVTRITEWNGIEIRITTNGVTGGLRAKYMVAHGFYPQAALKAEADRVREQLAKVYGASRLCTVAMQASIAVFWEDIGI